MVAAKRSTRFYPTADVPQPKTSRKNPKPAKLRKSITPGSVVILLAGRFRGKRVVCLKQLDSGLLLVTGPYKINGVPLRRVNQAYVIGTATKVNVEGLDVSKIDDAYFKKDESTVRSISLVCFLLSSFLLFQPEAWYLRRR